MQTLTSAPTSTQSSADGPLTPARINDAALIFLASPVLGIAVAWTTGIAAALAEQGGLRWPGVAALMLIAFVIWHGNRAIYFYARDRALAGSPRSSPKRRLVTVIGAAVLFTVPVAYGLLCGWYMAFAVVKTNWVNIHAAVALITSTSLFLAHAYESILLAREQAAQRLLAEQSERLHLQAKLSVLEAQLDPHFLYNALCGLGFLIETNRERAGDYVATLTEVYGYVSKQFSAPLVPLDEELAFARAFAKLLALRYGDAISISIPDSALVNSWRIVPISIQLALENAAKHNDMSIVSPLHIQVHIEEGVVNVINNKQALIKPVASLGIGLKNLSNRCVLSIARDTAIFESAVHFSIGIPLVRAESAVTR